MSLFFTSIKWKVKCICEITWMVLQDQWKILEALEKCLSSTFSYCKVRGSTKSISTPRSEMGQQATPHYCNRAKFKFSNILSSKSYLKNVNFEVKLFFQALLKFFYWSCDIIQDISKVRWTSHFKLVKNREIRAHVRVNIGKNVLGGKDAPLIENFDPNLTT